MTKKVHICNFCGKKFQIWDEQQGFGLKYPHIGFGSKYDGEGIEADFCCECFDKIIEALDECCEIPIFDGEELEF